MYVQSVGIKPGNATVTDECPEDFGLENTLTAERIEQKKKYESFIMESSEDNTQVTSSSPVTKIFNSK